jgi:putative MATE family efflux protein
VQDKTPPRLDHSQSDAQIPRVLDVFYVAWPLALKAIMLQGVVVIDTLLVSGLGEQSIAAMGLAASLGGILLGVLMAFSNATQLRIAQAFGSGTQVSLKTGFYCGLIINVAMTFLGLALVMGISPYALKTFAHTPWIAAEAQKYLNVFVLVVLAEAVGQCLSSHFNGCGKTKLSFYSYLIALPINVGCSVIFIHGHFGAPEMGVVGAAVGSAVAALVRLIFLASLFFKQTQAFRSVSGWHNQTLRNSLQRHFIFSWPIAATFISMTAANSVCLLIQAKLNVNQYAAMTLMVPWIHVAGTFMISWAQSIGITVAQMLGQKRSHAQLEEFHRRAWRAAFVAAAIVSLNYFVICIKADWIYSDLQQETTDTLLSFLPLLLLITFPKCSNAVCGHTLRAGGDTLYAMKLALTAQWMLKVPLTALFVLYFELSATWVFSIFLIEEIAKFPFFHKRLALGQWKLGTLAD